jgi:succinoglycan biosynthesis transport protein ExoP
MTMDNRSKAENVGCLGEYLGAFRRHYLLVASIAPLIILAAVYVSFALKAQFQSTATILLEPSSVPKDMVATTVVSYSSQQIEIVQGRVMTPDTLKVLVKEFDPYPNEKDLSTNQKAQRILEDTTLERVDPVTMKPIVESNAFSLHYNNPDPDRAVEVTNRLAQLFLTYNQRTRTEAAREATAFLEQQSQSISDKMRDIDAEMAKLKQQVGDALPELQMRNQTSLDRSQRDLDTLQQQIVAAESRESLLALQLNQLSPNLMTQTGDLTDLATVRAKLAEAEQRYTPDHPEVRRLRRAMETLMTQNGNNAASAGKPTNPQYLSVASQLDSARKELANLRYQAGKAREQTNQYSQLLQRTPNVERDYVEILRRKQSLQLEYQQIHDKLQNAELAQSFETEQRGERFTLLRAPFPGKSPVYPNRIGLILLGLVLGIGLAAIAVAIAESTDATVRNTRDLPELPGVPMLAAIPVILNKADRRRRRFVFGSYATVFSICVAVVGFTVFTAFHR